MPQRSVGGDKNTKYPWSEMMCGPMKSANEKTTPRFFMLVKGATDRRGLEWE